MNSVLHSPRPAVARKGFIRPLWLAGLGWFVACVASVTVAATSMPQAGWAADTVNTPAPAVAEVLIPRSTTRCRTCGVVEIVRIIQVAGAAPLAYELTVRLRDGSRRISKHSDSAGWRVGDSIMLIGGAKLADRT